MGSDQGKLPPSAQGGQEEVPASAELDAVLDRYEGRRQGRGGYGAMRVREAAVMPLPVHADEDYPALVDGILAHAFRVLRELDEQQVDIMLLRDDTRAALARLKAA